MLQLARLLAIILPLIASVALAQAPSPAQMGITSGTTPEILQTQDNTGTWVPMGAINPTTHSFSAFNANGLDVRTIGMKPGGQDNSPYVAALMNAATPTGSEAGGVDVFFPAIPGQIYTDYYFSKPFHVTRHMNIRCQGKVNGGGDSSTRLIFADGVHGVVFDNGGTSPDGSFFGGGGMSGCGIIDTSRYAGVLTSGSATITNVGMSLGWGVSSAPWAFQPGDGVIVYPGWEPPNGAPAVAAGAFLSAVNSVTETLTLASPYTSNFTRATSDNPIWRLPAADAFTVQTTIGSPTVTVTAGPSLIMPGDYVWSDAFPFGTVVKDVTSGGAVGSQTFTMAGYILNGPTTVNATVTHTSGSPGKMWIIPAAIKMYVQTSLHNNYIADFPFGLEMECSDWGTPTAGCNGSVAQENTFVSMIIGRLVVGNNSGASSSIANVYAHNSMTDIAELGSIGSVYLGDNSNSAETGTSIEGVIGLCGSNNFTSYIGMYAATNTATTGYCANGFNAAPGPGGTNMWIAPLQSAPPGSLQLTNGTLGGPWNFTTEDPSRSIVCFNGGTTYVMAFSISAICSGPNTFGLRYNSTANSWVLSFYNGAGGYPLVLTTGSTGGYTGYLGENSGQFAYPLFLQGMLLYDTEASFGTSPAFAYGAERLVDLGPQIPTGTFHKQGDIHFNQGATAGGAAGWIDTASGTSGYRQFGRIANDAAGTSWPVASPVVIASLVTCSASTVGFGVVTNGVTVGTAGYGAAVSATGAVTRPVFCDGTGWTYH